MSPGGGGEEARGQFLLRQRREGWGGRGVGDRGHGVVG